MGVKGFFFRDNKTHPIIDNSGSTGMSSEKLSSKNTNDMQIQQIQSQKMNDFAKEKAKHTGRLVVKGAKGLHEAKKKNDENKELQKQANIAQQRNIESMIDDVIFNTKTSANEKFEKLQRLAINLRDDGRLDERNATVINRNLKRLVEEKPHEIQPKSNEASPATVINPRPTTRPTLPRQNPTAVVQSTPSVRIAPTFTASVGESSNTDDDDNDLPENLKAEIATINPKKDDE